MVVVGSTDGDSARLEMSTPVVTLHWVLSVVTLDALTLPRHTTPQPALLACFAATSRLV